MQAWINLYLSMLTGSADLGRQLPTIAILDRKVFPNGHMFLRRSLPQLQHVCPAIAHFNWIRQSGDKLAAMKEYGMFEVVWSGATHSWTCKQNSILDDWQRCPVHLPTETTRAFVLGRSASM